MVCVCVWCVCGVFVCVCGVCVCVCVCVCLIECEQETSTMRQHKPDLSCCGTEKKDCLTLYREIMTINVGNRINTMVYNYNVCQTVRRFDATKDGNKETNYRENRF